MYLLELVVRSRGSCCVCDYLTTMKSITTFFKLLPNCNMSSDSHPNTPGHEPSYAQQEHGVRYLIRCRRALFNRELIIDTQLIQNLCKHEALNEEKVIHVGTSSTESHVHIVFNYNNYIHDAVQIRGFKFKSRRWKKISIPLEMKIYLNNRVEKWKSQRKNGVQFPIRDVVCFFTYSCVISNRLFIWQIYPKESTDPNAPRNLIRTTRSAVPTCTPPEPPETPKVETKM